MISLDRERNEFQWFVAYKWHFEISQKENLKNKVWTSGIAKAECITEIFDIIELESWCTSMFDFKHKLLEVKLSGKTRVPLIPNIFIRMLQIPLLDKVLSLSETDSVLDAQAGEMNLLKNCLVQPSFEPDNPNHIDICMLVEPYKEFTWLFACLVS